MDFSNDPLISPFPKRFLTICHKELARIIRAIATVLMRKILRGLWFRSGNLQALAQRCKHLFHITLYPLLVGCLVLFLPIGDQRLYAFIYLAPVAPEITLTLDNGTILPILASPISEAAYAYVNADSILYAVKNATGIDCKGTTVLNVPAGKPPVLIRLSDGTLVHLNVLSRLCFPACFMEEQRVVELEGEAYFEVSKNEQHPFIVRTQGFEVKVLGTKFNISNYTDNDKAQVSLLEGSILFQIENKEKNVQAGQAITLDHESGKISIGNVDKRITAWRNGIYFFDREPLETICKNAYRLYGTTIFIESKQLANQHFYGSINRGQNLETFLGYLRATSNIDYYYDAKKQVHLRCPNN